jgi:cysteinyl-tRNA synthetase
MAKLYKEDMALLGCLAPDVEPKVSEHVTDITALIERLVAIGSAYPQRMSTGLVDVYFSVRSFPGYGKLSKRKLDDQQAGARVEASEEKRDPADFALWKGAAPDAWGWESPWGRGRPGWHIECSAMASRYLGHGLDVHTGGMDLVFPHHENEIAQSEAAHPGEGPFCGLWIHNGFVNADKEKMAKSLGNFVTIRQVYERNDPEALRYFLLGVHYRGPIAFDTHKRDDGRVVFPGVLEAERRVDYLYGTMARLRSLQVGSSISTLTTMHKELVPFARLAHEARPRVDEALDDDLNTSVALSVVAEVATAANEFVDFAFRKKKDSEIAQATPIVAGQLMMALKSALDPLGLLKTSAEAYGGRTRERRLHLLGMTAEQVDAMLAERTAARRDKDFARADALRAELDSLGFEIADGPAGTTWHLGPV